jgi:hypothetical protein
MRRVPTAPELVAARVLAQADILRRCVGCQDGPEADCQCASRDEHCAVHLELPPPAKVIDSLLIRAGGCRVTSDFVDKYPAE